MKPRERIGQFSIAKAAPTGHSAPMPMPNRARNRNRNQKAGEKAAMKLQAEYHAIEIINGFLRPIRSASQPEAVAPTRRIHNVNVKTAVTSVSGTSEFLRDRQHDQQKNRKIERVEGPPEPSRHPGVPLLFRRLLPPRHGVCNFTLDCRHDALLLRSGPCSGALQKR